MKSSKVVITKNNKKEVRQSAALIRPAVVRGDKGQISKL